MPLMIAGRTPSRCPPARGLVRVFPIFRGCRYGGRLRPSAKDIRGDLGTEIWARSFEHGRLDQHAIQETWLVCDCSRNGGDMDCLRAEPWRRPPGRFSESAG